MKINAYFATSLDGFIARTDGSLDWLPQPEADGEDYGYSHFFNSMDVLVMGRNTYETVLTFGEWPYADKRVFVLSSRKLDMPAFVPQILTQRACSPGELAQELSTQGVEQVYVDGGKTIQSFLRAGLLDEITISIIPVLIGRGIPLFGPLDADVKLQVVESQSFENGIIQNRYMILR
jgi:dihydrofolate reductase